MQEAVPFHEHCFYHTLFPNLLLVLTPTLSSIISCTSIHRSLWQITSGKSLRLKVTNHYQRLVLTYIIFLSSDVLQSHKHFGWPNTQDLQWEQDSVLHSACRANGTTAVVLKLKTKAVLLSNALLCTRNHTSSEPCDHWLEKANRGYTVKKQYFNK